MLFVWMGFLKADVGPVPQDVQQQTNDFLQQPYIPIRSVGQLRDEAGNRAGMIMIFEVEDRAAAEALVENSPYRTAGLYESYKLYEFLEEIG
jgi:hypothetical protein